MLKGYKAILEELSRTALNIPAGELSELIPTSDEELNEEQSQKIFDAISGQYRKVISSINITNNKQLDEKFKAGQRKKAEEIEGFLKTTFGVDSDKTGQELIEEIQSEVSKKQPSSKKGDLTDDDVKKHPAFIKMEADFKKQLKEQKETLDKEIGDLKAGYSKKELFTEVSKEGLKEFDSLNPVLSENSDKAAAQRQLVVDKLEGYDWEKVEGKFIALKDGKRVENEFGHPLELKDLVKQTGELYFDFRKAEERESPNGDKNKNQGSGDGDDDKNKQTSYKGKLPKTADEYNQMMNDTSLSIKDKLSINDHWEKASASQS